MISMQAGNFVPVPFRNLLDPETGRAKIRMVDIRSTRYAIARRYMIRLRRDDFEDSATLAQIAAAAGMSVADFRRNFEYLIETELPPIVLRIASSVNGRNFQRRRSINLLTLSRRSLASGRWPHCSTR